MRCLMMMALGCMFATLANANPLYKWQSHDVTASSLPPALQQKMYDLDKKRHDDVLRLVDDYIFEQYLLEFSQKKSVSSQSAEEELLKVPSISEKELKEFYEHNKAIIPYSFESIRFELKSKMLQEKRAEKKALIIAEQKKKNQFAWLEPAPKAPQFQIEVASNQPTKGNPQANITLIEFGDYKCPYCAKAYDVIERVMAKVGKKVKFVYLDFPNERSDLSFHLAKGGYCTWDSGKFWEYHKEAFKNQAQASYDFPLAFAKKHKLDMKRFEACLNSADTKAHVEASRSKGLSLGVELTPGLYLNGAKISLDNGASGLEHQIEKL